MTRMPLPMIRSAVRPRTLASSGTAIVPRNGPAQNGPPGPTSSFTPWATANATEISMNMRPAL